MIYHKLSHNTMENENDKPVVEEINVEDINDEKEDLKFQIIDLDRENEYLTEQIRNNPNDEPFVCIMTNNITKNYQKIGLLKYNLLQLEGLLQKLPNR